MAPSMDFVKRPYEPGETIAALATPPGEGGVAIIRISGNNAASVAGKVFSRPVNNLQSHKAYFGKVVDSVGAVIDEVLLLPMLAPKSYTGEDVFEIHCHGGSLIARKVLETVLQAGARAALPGEFTFKAFMNGKIDLAQAEAVQSLIAAKNELALSAAEKQLQGILSDKIESFQKELIDTASILEAWVDFPEEGLEFATQEEIISSLKTTRNRIANLASTFHNGKLLQHGISLCLAGPPNVGKSSLMNALLKKERAIVTEFPGTTRDLLEEELRLGNLHFRLTDTAGIRETDERIEKEGIRRSFIAMEQADLILLVLDISQTIGPYEKELITRAPKEKTILIWNKVDLDQQFIPKEGIAISAKMDIGLDQLEKTIQETIWKKGAPSREEIVITQERHYSALAQAIKYCDAMIEGLQNNTSPEFIASDMRQALTELGTVIGMDISEDILSAIFSKFCVGK